uniref:Amidophosphoribosyltransferase n=1 Tax=uncultured Thermoplasmata archaeon TaxID=376542 RepID=A0A871Y7Q5_9ARCH|nr:Amidophosphoribosyltransferase [uncultured Thermoplasmata archaeon]
MIPDAFKSDKPKEACAVVAMRCKQDVASYIYYALRALQHRGQEASGIAVYAGGLKVRKGIGLVSEVIGSEDIEKLQSKVGIGHNYYSIKVSKPENVQPQFLKTGIGDVAIAHNGIIVNSGILIAQLKKEGKNFILESEEEAFIMKLTDAIRNTDDIPKSIKAVCKELIGSYAFALLVNDRVFAIRDPYGIRPLCLGKLKDGKGYIAASESVALDVIGAEFIRDVMPGEAVEITEDGFKSINIGGSINRAHCFFEWVYFARADSVIDGVSVYEARKRIGWRLAKEAPAVADVVMPIPDSGRAHAYGYALGSGIKMNEGLMKNRYIHRTFIMPTQDAREISVREKMNPVRAVVEGKRVVIVDDSIVRGTTMKKIVKMLKDAGATEVHVRIGSPPLIAPCYLGIDMTNRDQFIADRKSVDDIRKEIDADSLAYISIEGLVEALNFEKENLCLGCVSGEYPVSIPGERRRFQQTLEGFT